MKSRFELETRDIPAKQTGGKSIILKGVFTACQKQKQAVAEINSFQRHWFVWGVREGAHKGALRQADAFTLTTHRVSELIFFLWKQLDFRDV